MCGPEIKLPLSFLADRKAAIFSVAALFISGEAEIIAQSVLRKNPAPLYQTIALPQVETDGHIRYFLEIKGKKPLPADTLIEPKELYVLCFALTCKVLGNPQWKIASFKNAKIEKNWKVEGVRIYKLTHIYN